MYHRDRSWSCIRNAYMPMTPPLRGYTLLEMIVSVGLFSVVMLVATAAYLTLISMDRQTRTTSDLMTNMSFVVDSMTRSIRTGSQYCVAGCLTNRFSFTDSEGREVVYALDDGVITRQIDSSVPLAITDSRITIGSEDLRFYVWGENAGPADGQPRVHFTIRGTVSADSNAPDQEFVVQGGATQRIIDI